MYAPDAFRVEERSVLLAFIEAHPFATLVTPAGDGLQVSHVPLDLVREAEVLLRGHLARENPHVAALAAGRESLAIFHGPHAYVSPGWYAKGPAVPTWNYAVVHAHGVPVVRDEAQRKRAHLDRLIAHYESGRETPWSADRLPESFRRGLERGIVAFELSIERLEGKFKLGQNRSEADRAGTVEGLEREGDPASLALAAFARVHGFGE